jgi:phosphoglycolate phosphatase
MGRIAGLLIDKDGTLLDFQSYWIPVSRVLIARLLERLGVGDPDGQHRERLLRAIGISGDAVVSRSAVASGTGADVARSLHGALRSEIGGVDPDSIRLWLDEDYLRMAPSFEHRMRPYPGGDRAIARLAGAGIKLGVATSDTSDAARYALKTLGYSSHFSFIGGSDTVASPKPDPEMARHFCETIGAKPGEIAMVGDTEIDMMFARNAGAGMAIAVLTGVGTRSDLEPLADVVVDSLEEVANLLAPSVSLP